jgi:hypothetical protein
MFRMSYKNVFWPINPEQYRQVSQREPVYSKDGSGNSVVTGAGPVQVTVTGSGAFSGSGPMISSKHCWRCLPNPARVR